VTARSCADVAVRLSAWIDGELDASAAAGVQEHLAGCASCQRRRALLTAASRAVRSLPAEAVSAGFEDAFRRRLAAARTAAENPRRRSTVTIAAAGLAAVLVLAVLGPFALRRASMPGEAPTRSNEVPRWLAACGAPTAAECLPDTPCASAATCGVVVPAGAPCASAATCGVVSVASLTSAGHSPPANRPPSRKRR
jgi:anti-sigma factor RsiW